MTMYLPVRINCFACNKPQRPLKNIVWQSTEVRLVTCTACRSEWLEGSILSNQAYCYQHINTDPLTQAYQEHRAHRFGLYLERFATNNHGDLLDIGCGTGEFCHWAHKRGWHPVGVELCGETVKLARARTGLTFIAGDISRENLLPNSSFDVITLWGVLEHVLQPYNLLKTCKKLLRPHGLILLETPNALAMFRLVARNLLKVTSGRLTRPFLEILGAGHVVWYTPDGIYQTANRLGLRVKDINGTRNYTRNIISRFNDLFLPLSLFCKAGTIILNYFAAPLGRPNQLFAALSYP